MKASEGGIFMKEALLYDKLPDGSVKCGLCFRKCLIPDKKRGHCGVRENREGTLYALTYGLADAIQIDPIEKKPLYHFMPGTKTYSIGSMGCNLFCRWCQNHELSQNPKPDKPVIGHNVTPIDHVKMAKRYGCPSISYTYSEPTVWLEYALETMKLAKEAGLANIWVTNGEMSYEALEKILPTLDAANVDLKSIRDDVFRAYCGGDVESVLSNVKTMKKAGIHLEVTTLVVPGVNDSDSELTKMANFIAEKLGKDTPWHISRFFPAWRMDEGEPTPATTLKRARAIGENAGLENIHIGNIREWEMN